MNEKQTQSSTSQKEIFNLSMSLEVFYYVKKGKRREKEVGVDGGGADKTRR